MDYEAAISYIKTTTKNGIKLGLERISALLEYCGEPQRRFRAIHIAGTNGKGSTVAMFESVLRRTGLKVGRYTSPHLTDYRERFVVDGQNISKAELAELVTKLQAAVAFVQEQGLGPPTEFELGTALAFLYFAERQVDLALIEVGMGGRFDATNVLEPILTVITHIALDHQEFLGETLQQIAFEKAGIIKKGVPVVIGLQEPQIESYLVELTMARQAPFYLASNIKIGPISLSEAGTSFEAELNCFGKQPLCLGLLGEHQAFNSLNLLASLHFLAETGVKITSEELAAGLQKAVWPGRLELISRNSTNIYLDGAHNPDGVRALVDTFRKIYPGRRADLLVGILGNRPLRQMAELLGEIAQRVIVTTVPDPKAASVNELAAAFDGLGVEVLMEPDPGQALARLLGLTNSLGLICGSLYLVGWLRPKLLEERDRFGQKIDHHLRSIRER